MIIGNNANLLNHICTLVLLKWSMILLASSGSNYRPLRHFLSFFLLRVQSINIRSQILLIVYLTDKRSQVSDSQDLEQKHA